MPFPLDLHALGTPLTYTIFLIVGIGFGIMLEQAGFGRGRQNDCAGDCPERCEHQTGQKPGSLQLARLPESGGSHCEVTDPGDHIEAGKRGCDAERERICECSDADSSEHDCERKCRRFGPDEAMPDVGQGAPDGSCHDRRHRRVGIRQVFESIRLTFLQDLDALHGIKTPCQGPVHITRPRQHACPTMNRLRWPALAASYRLGVSDVGHGCIRIPTDNADRSGRPLRARCGRLSP